MSIILFISFALSSEPKYCLKEKKELYVGSVELSRLGDKGINGLKLSNLMACQTMLKGIYNRDKDNCSIQAEVCFNN